MTEAPTSPRCAPLIQGAPVIPKSLRTGSPQNHRQGVDRQGEAGRGASHAVGGRQQLVMQGVAVEKLPQHPGDVERRAEVLEVVLHQGQGLAGALVGHLHRQVELGRPGGVGGDGPGHQDLLRIDAVDQGGGDGQQDAAGVVGPHPDHEADLGFLRKLGLQKLVELLLPLAGRAGGQLLAGAVQVPAGDRVDPGLFAPSSAGRRLRPGTRAGPPRRAGPSGRGSTRPPPPRAGRSGSCS